MRRIAFPAAFLLFLSLAAGIFAPARAQEATPMGGALTGYPKLSVTITDATYELDSTTVPAGWIILSVKNGTEEETGAAVLGPPPGMTGDQLEQMASTPEPNDGFPQFLYQAVVAGGPSGIQPGETLEAIINVPAGDWAVFGEGNQQASRFTSVDGPDSVTTEPTATATIDTGDFYFGGLDSGFPAGPQLVKITNSGKQPHMIVMGKGPDDMTMDQVMAIFSQPENATPAPGGLSFSDLTFVPGVTLISSAETMYMPMNLTAGTYLALCFVTDPATGAPHAMEGMATTFNVS